MGNIWNYHKEVSQTHNLTQTQKFGIKCLYQIPGNSSKMFTMLKNWWFFWAKTVTIKSKTFFYFWNPLLAPICQHGWNIKFYSTSNIKLLNTYVFLVCYQCYAFIELWTLDTRCMVAESFIHNYDLIFLWRFLSLICKPLPP